ncbi:MAG: hypothetical protein Ta2A_17150 [Treponemataceae bacterium]|nr:MAG: hypothetical protein Ta2A_17150 [Treponemataceae bacterium]
MSARQHTLRCGFAVCILCLFPLFADASDEDFPLDAVSDFSPDAILIEDGVGITITASPATSQQMKIITKDEIEKSNARDAASLLQDMLNLGITAYGGYGAQSSINVRGFDSARVAFLVDGIPQNSPLSGDFDINTIDLASIERIEVSYGGSDTKYNVSGALGGVVNIITVKKQDAGLKLSFALSNTSNLLDAHAPHYEDLADAQNFTFSAAYGEKSFSAKGSLFANRAANHFLYQDWQDVTRRKIHNEVHDAGGSFSAVFDLPDKLTKVIASLDGRYADANIPTSGYSLVYGSQKDFSARQNLFLDMPRVFSDNFALEASVSNAFAQLDYEQGDSRSKHVQDSVSVINRWSWYCLDALSVKFGGDYRYVALASGEMGSHGRHDGGVYLGMEYKPVKKVLLIPSVKAVFTGTAGTASQAVVPVPKLGLVWNVAPWVTLKNNYFRSFKLPDMEDLYWNSGMEKGNPDLKSEDGWGADFSASFFRTPTKSPDASPIENLQFDTTAFVQWTDNSIHWNSASGKWQPENVGKAFFFGLDNAASLTFRLPTRFSDGTRKNFFDKIKVSASYQFLLSYLLSYGYTWQSKKRIPYMPMHTAGGSVEVQWKTGTSGAGSLAVFAHFESRRYHDTANTATLPQNFLLHATFNQRIGQRIGQSATVFASFRNILNTHYVSMQYYPMPPFSVTIGVKATVDVNTVKQREKTNSISKFNHRPHGQHDDVRVATSLLRKLWAGCGAASLPRWRVVLAGSA